MIIDVLIMLVCSFDLLLLLLLLLGLIVDNRLVSVVGL